MPLQSRGSLELLAADTACLVVCIWAEGLVLSPLVPIVKVLVTLLAVVMLVALLFVALHRLLTVEPHFAAPISALDALRHCEEFGVKPINCVARLVDAMLLETAASGDHSRGIRSKYFVE